jgi:ArsR family transcriptional regulator
MQEYAYSWRCPMKETVKAFKVLSDETKLRILCLVMERECCVCEVMQAMEISQSKASRGLAALYDAGFLKFRKDGLWSVYSIDREGMHDYQRELIEAARDSLKDERVVALDRERLKRAKRSGFGCAPDLGTILSPDKAD